MGSENKCMMGVRREYFDTEIENLILMIFFPSRKTKDGDGGEIRKEDGFSELITMEEYSAFVKLRELGPHG